jgi:MinD superfamily P-loop ATPase
MPDVKEIVVVSGKGGTGKTTFVAALASLMRNKVIADCDVDAANLHLVIAPDEVLDEREFIGGRKATIDKERCTRCGLCRELCRFRAISEDFVVDRFGCEGCGACHFLCPAGAVEFSPRRSGYCYTYKTKKAEKFVFAELLPGEENSGKLVAMVRNEARNQGELDGSRFILLDGPPGIGCPVISSLTGTHLAIVVTEPTPTGIHDLERIVALTKHFQVKAALIVNRSDINPDHVEAMKNYSARDGLAFLGEIPYDPLVTEAQRERNNILDFAPDSPASRAIREISIKLHTILEEL